VHAAKELAMTPRFSWIPTLVGMTEIKPVATSRHSHASSVIPAETGIQKT